MEPLTGEERLAPAAHTATSHTNSQRTTAIEEPLTVSNDDRKAIHAYLTEFAAELGDTAPLKSSVTRVLRIYCESSLTLSGFIQALYTARSRTKERATSIHDYRKRFAYFLALLEEECGLREPPPEIAAAARRRALQADEPIATASAMRAENSNYYVVLPDGTDGQKLWDRARSWLADQVTRSIYETYLKPAAHAATIDGRLVVHTTSDFAAEWLDARLRSRVEQAVFETYGMAVAIDFIATESGAETSAEG